MKKILAIFMLTAVIAAALSGCAKQRPDDSNGEDDKPVDMGAIYYNGSTESETFLVGLDGKNIKASDIKYLTDKKSKPTNVLDEKNFGHAICEGFVYAFKPSVYFGEESSPEMFRDGEYIGESSAASSEYFKVRVGDKFGNLTVKSADCKFCASTIDGQLHLGYMEGEIEFDGEITLTGLLDIPPLLTNYGDLEMEMHFYSDLENGLPLSLECLYKPEFSSDIYHCAGSGYKTYSDLPLLDIGKLSDYDLDFDGLTHGDTARVEITVTELRLIGQLGNICFAYGKLVDIKRL